jgi:hypothetical protein
MSTKNFGFGVCVTAAVVAIAGMRAAPAAASQPCVFEKYAPSAYVPFSPEQGALIDDGSYSPLRGAQLFIPAHEGLTRQWLKLALERALLEASPTAPKSNDVACNPPHVKLAQINVTSAGDGFWVQLISANERDASALVNWAAQVVKSQRASR